MARTALQKVYADFRQGFVTVANPLAYPEGSLKDIVNFDIKDNGTVRLRAGLRQESQTTVDTGVSLNLVNTLALSCHIWYNVNNNGDEKIAVVQVGGNVYLFAMNDTEIDLSTVLATPGLGIGAEGQSEPISVTSGSGKLFIAHPDIEPVFIERDKDNNYIVKPITIRIRDLTLWRGNTEEETGLGDSLQTLYPYHEYNLRNGGWPEQTFCSQSSDPDTGVTNTDPVAYFNTKRSRYPSISYPFSAGKAGGGSTVSRQNAFSPWAFDTDYFGSTEASVGSKIVNAASWSRVGEGVTAINSGVPLSKTLTKTYEWTRNPSAIEFYSGRVWYTGAKGYKETVDPLSVSSDTPNDELDVSNLIYFSQQLGSDLKKVGECYQLNDPTAEDINQLLATDGGTISIRGAGEILDIKTFGTALIVFATQGVWAISGIDANSFTATEFSVEKVSNIGPSSKRTISATDKDLYYITDDAIYVLGTDQVTGLPTPQDITSGLIKDFYIGLSTRQKANARPLFDPANKLFYMFYSDLEDPNDTNFGIVYNKVLVFNQALSAWYKYDIPLTSNSIVDGIFYYKDNVVNIETLLTIDGEQLQIDGEDLAVVNEYSTAALSNLQFLTIIDPGDGSNVDFTFSSFTDTANFQDFGADYTGSIEFGFDSAGDIMRDSLKAPVIISHMERTEDGFEINPNDPDGQELILTNQSSCLLSYGWDWATSYGNQFQLYRFNRNYVPSGTEDTFDYGKDIITTRNRIRGKGYSLGIRLDSEAGKDCRLLGLGILYTAAQRI